MIQLLQNEKNRIIGYHGTDDSVRLGIEKNNGKFKIHKNENHWITDGVYFFLEKNKAEWWATSKHKGFGVDINNPIVIKVKINNKNNICDLRNKKDYLLCNYKYKEFIRQMFRRGNPKNIDSKTLNNAFFKFFRTSCNFDVFIVGFDKTENKEKKESCDLKKYLDIPYVEVQMCVCDIDLIDIIGYYNVE